MPTSSQEKTAYAEKMGDIRRSRVQPYTFFVPASEDQGTRDAVFMQMCAEGLLPHAMSSIMHPTLEQWRHLTAPQRAWLLLCQAFTGERLGVALLTPWRGQTWEFDFTCFRQGMPFAVDMARQATNWIFQHAPVQALWGICPASYRHVRRLAGAAGFTVKGTLPNVCWIARKGCFEDGIFFVALAKKSLSG